MSSSLQRKADARQRLDPDEDPLAVPADARPTDDSPTVISKTPPIVEPSTQQGSLNELARKSSPESLVASLRGRRLAHYELIEPIGVGGMAAVIRVRDTQLDRFVALKVLPPEMASEPENIRRFHQEARAAAKLDHENIARVFFCGEDQGLHFIAFEYVEGNNLRTMLEQRGRVPVAEAVRYILQVATGLEHAATRGVVHRDVKPSNIIVTPTGRAKLVDMGLARNLERHGETDLTQSGMTLGTFDYISPEQALEPRDADMRSDIYSLGCTLYHLLTGQAPVPEGTPAKKLQHHQNQSPVDPRRINPSVPDEIVMILSRMMAKNPKDRYQRPIHLVHHLMQIAQKVGVADDLPEGVMFVDTPLPGQPRSRPILYIGAALLALIAVTLLLSLAPDKTPNNKGNGSVKSGEPVEPKGNGKSDIKPPDIPQPPIANARPDVIASQADLQAVLSDPDAREIKAKIDASGYIELNGMTFKGGKDRRLVLESDDALNNILHFSYANNARPIGLVIDGGEEVIFRKIKFEIEQATSAIPTQAVAALALRGVKSVVFDQCIFTQDKVQKLPAPSAGLKRVPLASLLIDAGENPAYAQPVIFMKECYFESNSKDGGQVAVAINGPAMLTVKDTAFRPHTGLFSFRDKCTLENTILNMQSCSSFLVGPAFRFSEKASAELRVEKSVFSKPAKMHIPAVGQPGLIYLAGDKAIQFKGSQNLYHALNDFVEKKSEFIGQPEKFQQFLAKLDGSDVSSTFIDLSEATKTPFANADPLSESEVLAFQLNAEYARPELGVQRTWLGQFMPKAAALVKAPPPMGPKKLVVDPQDGRRNNQVEFKTVAEALLRAKNGDVIEIKHGDDDPEVTIQPIPLRPGLTVTLKASEGFKPTLVLDKEFKEKDSALFKLQEGKLQFEGLRFLLDPAHTGFESQSVVHLGEAAHCIFKQCIVSLRTQTDVPLNVVAFVDLNLMMKMETTPPPARVEFLDCFIRGHGDLVALRGCRLLHVDMKNSLVALDGSLLDIMATDKNMRMSDGVRWKMERTSVFITDSIFALRSKTANGLSRTEADIKQCLFVSLQPDKPVILLDTKDNDLNKYIEWKGEQNYYANFDKDKVREWQELFGGTKADAGRLTLPKLTDKNLQSLWDAEPDWFKPTEPELERIQMQNIGQPTEVEAKLVEMLGPEDP